MDEFDGMKWFKFSLP